MSNVHLVSKVRRLFVSLAVAVVPVLALAGCSPSSLGPLGALFGPKPEEAAQEALKADLDSLKTADEQTIKDLFGEDVVSEMETYGIDPKEFYDSLVKHFSYDNMSATAKDDSNVTVKLTTTNVDIQAVATQWQNDVLEYMNSSQAMEDYATLGEDGLMKKMMGSLVDALAADDAPTKSADVTIDMKKGSDGTWAPSDESQVSNAIFAGADLDSDLAMS